MKILFVVSLAIYIASVTGRKNSMVDLRYPIDTSIIQAALNDDSIINLIYDVNESKTVINYQIVDVLRGSTCGPNKIEVDENHKYAQNVHILPLNQDNVLLIPMEHDSEYNEYPIKMELVNLPKCKRTDIILPIKKKPTDFKVTKYIDSFDIYYKDPSNPEKTYGRASYDFQGNVISTPNISVQSHKALPLIKAIGSGERSNKYIAYDFMDKKTIVNLVDSDKVKILAESTTMSIPEVSTSHNLISIAYLSKVEPAGLTEVFSIFKILQFDLNGNLKFDTDVKLNGAIRTVRILNSPDGGVYFVGSECDRDNCSDEQNLYSIAKFNANGKEVGSLVTRLPSPGIIEDLSFYENGNSYCLTRAQLSLGVSGKWQFKKLDIISNCLTDKDFE